MLSWTNNTVISRVLFHEDYITKYQNCLILTLFGKFDLREWIINENKNKDKAMQW